MRSLRPIWRPEMYQGRKQMKNYFEGWYFKVVDRHGDNAYAFIPGISFGSSPDEDHSFIQVLRGSDAFATYNRYNRDEFISSPSDFRIKVGKSSFSLDGIHVDIEGDGLTVQGNLRFDGVIPWPVSRFSPGAMGPFRFMPRMECLHGILSFDHWLTGSLSINGEPVDFSQGRGYIEKDWGRGFPSSWIWMQSNYFPERGVSFTSSIATIPWLNSSFAGYLIGLLHEGEVYRFTTYTGARISDIRVSENDVKFKVYDRNHAIVVHATRAGGGTLRSPVQGLMSGRIVESLNAKIGIKFYRSRGRGYELLYEGIGRTAGLEVVGDMAEIGGEYVD